MGQTATADAQPSRTWIHVFGAFAAAVILAISLMLAPGLGAKLRARQTAALQAGALVDLKLIYDSQTQFHKANGFYTTDLWALKIAPKKVVYKFGFLHPSAEVEGREDLVPSRKDLDALKKAYPKLKLDYSPVTGLAALDFERLSSFCQDCTATQKQFKAIAAANLDQDPVLDVWTIDEMGAVSHVINDLN